MTSARNLASVGQLIAQDGQATNLTLNVPDQSDQAVNTALDAMAFSAAYRILACEHGQQAFCWIVDGLSPCQDLGLEG